MQTEFAKLKTPYAENTGWKVYPRPNLKRDSFYSLNGEWEFEISKDSEIPEIFSRKIIVPFAPESMLSGIDEVFDESYYRFYRKTFSLGDGFIKERIILNFGAVDSVCRVYLNGRKLCKHVGGYGHFSIDITVYLLEENVLTVCVSDRLSKGILPYGKQRRKRGGMWYTPVSGIWQTVWIESVSQEHIRDLKITTHKNIVDIRFDGIFVSVCSVSASSFAGEYEWRGHRLFIRKFFDIALYSFRIDILK